MLSKNQRIFIAGHNGMVGSALVRRLNTLGFSNLITRSHHELDLLDQAAVSAFISDSKPAHIMIAAAKVGGIHANSTYPAEFIYQNLMIVSNLIHSAYLAGCRQLLFLGSSCIYPRRAEQPLTEETLLTGELEPTNEPYAIAKIAGIKLCESYNRQYDTDYRSVMPTNLYGPRDNYHPENSHVMAALLRRIHEAKIQAAEEVVVWGSGTPRREFMHVDDMAAASIHVMQLDRSVYRANTDAMLSHINIGTGKDVTIRELAETLRTIIGFTGKLVFDLSKPDGMLRKCLDVSLLRKLGWTSKISFRDGIEQTYQAYLKESAEAPG